MGAATPLVPDRRANAARLLAALSRTRLAREAIRIPPTSAARTSPLRRIRRLCLVMDQAVLRVARRIAVLPPARVPNGQLARSRRTQLPKPCTAGMACLPNLRWQTRSVLEMIASRQLMLALVARRRR